MYVQIGMQMIKAQEVGKCLGFARLASRLTDRLIA